MENKIIFLKILLFNAMSLFRLFKASGAVLGNNGKSSLSGEMTQFTLTYVHERADDFQITLTVDISRLHSPQTAIVESGP